MNKEIALASLEMAIKGQPNSTLSEHTRRLQKVYDWLESEPVAPSPPPEAPAPVLSSFEVFITLSDTILAQSRDEAWEIALDKIADRRGMDISRHSIHETE